MTSWVGSCIHLERNQVKQEVEISTCFHLYDHASQYYECSLLHFPRRSLLLESSRYKSRQRACRTADREAWGISNLIHRHPHSPDKIGINETNLKYYSYLSQLLLFEKWHSMTNGHCFLQKENRAEQLGKRSRKVQCASARNNRRCCVIAIVVVVRQMLVRWENTVVHLFPSDLIGHQGEERESA